MVFKSNLAEADCVHYFRNTLKLKNQHKRFTHSSWIKKFENSTTDFNMQPPTSVEITKVIMKTKLSPSPCPLDQVSAITFKTCPVLRSHLTNILQTALTEKTFLDVWESGVTVLTYKMVTLKIHRTFVQSPCNLYFRKYLLPLFEIDFSTSLQKGNTLKRIFKKVFGRKYQAVSNTSNVYRIS